MNLVRWLFRGVTPLGSLSLPAQRFFDIFDGTANDSGIKVDRDKALTYGAVWRATSVVAAAVAKSPVYIYRRLDGGGKERDVKHPHYSIVARKPSAALTRYQFWLKIMADVLLGGNGYAGLLRQGPTTRGKVIAMVPLDPADVSVYKTPDPQFPGFVYQIMSGGVEYWVHPRDVMHIRGLGSDGYQGYSVMDFAAETLGLGLAQRKYGAVFFKNNARPSMVLEHPGKLGKDARQSLREQWNEDHQGLQFQHRMAVLQEGMKVTTIGQTARESQLIESRQFELRDVANFFGVPPHKVGDTTRTAFASLEQENQSFLDDGVDPWLVNAEQELTDKLLFESEKDRDSHFVEFNRNAFVRANFVDRFAGYNSALVGGWMSRDEVRARENLNPIPDGSGATFLVPLNMAPSGQDSQPGRSAEPTAAGRGGLHCERAAAEAVLVEVIGRTCARLGFTARKLAKRGIAPDAWKEDAVAELWTTAANMLAATVRLFASDERAAVNLIMTSFVDVAAGRAAELDARLANWEATFPPRLAGQLLDGKAA